MDSDYEKGYKAGYEACVQFYKKRDLTLLKKNRVFEETYFLHRPDFMSNLNPTDSALKKFIDMKTFYKNVKSARKRLEVLNLGDYFFINETGLTFELDNDTDELSIEEQITNHIINYYKNLFLKS